MKLKFYILLIFFNYLNAYDDHFLFKDNFYKNSIELFLDSSSLEQSDNYNDLKLSGILNKTQSFNYSIRSFGF